MTDLMKTPSLDVKKSSKKEATRRTIRLEVKLFEPTKDTFPRYNVGKLKEKYLKKKKESDTENTMLLIDDTASASAPSFSDHENDDVARLAKKFEEKYGNAYEMADKGAGYDENDSFIDNTEAFDEVLTSDTPCGGFYINSGPLKFDEKKDSNGNPNTSKAEKSSGGMKKRLSLSSNESDMEEEPAGEKKKPKKNKMKKQKQKEAPEPSKSTGKEFAIKDILRIQRDNFLKTKTESPKTHKNRIVSDDDESDADSVALSESDSDSDVKFVDTPTCPSDLPEDVQQKINEFQSLADGKTGDQVLMHPELYQILSDIEGSSTLPRDKKISIKNFLSSVCSCQELYRKVQKERPWDTSVTPMETDTAAISEPQAQKSTSIVDLCSSSIIDSS
ncbi:ubinuclein-2 [Culicoides brevitarsis]|uniref:ubinuclein-2 n=1 Tax=Culicoides brevitarsis TaxID=469753 RepID=UPI00307B46DE